MTRDLRISSLWLAAALVMTTATLLRIPGLPLGPGEALLFSWLAVEGTRFALQPRVQVTPHGRAFLLFWAVSFLPLLFGWLFAMAHQVNAVSAGHDFVAYCLVAVFGILLANKRHSAAQIRATAPLLVVMITAAYFGLLILTLLGMLPFYGRFTGWSKNPNQAALAVTAVPFLALYLRRTAETARARMLWGVVIVLSLIVGAATMSDGLVLAWALSGVIVLTASWWRMLRRGRAPYWRAVLSFVVLPLLVIGSTVIFAPRLVSKASATVESIYYGDGSQGSVRVALWRTGFKRIGESPVFGWGPGAHSNLRGDAHISEAHNGPIDWTTATGLVGLIAFLSLHGWVAWRARRHVAVLGAVVALLVLGLTHHDLRHPLYWYFILLAAVTGSTAGAPGERAVAPGPAVAAGAGS